MDKALENAIKEVAENVPKVYEVGCKKGFEEGKAAERSDFWDVFQNYGKSEGMNYNGAFSYDRFDNKTYNPKYPIITINNTTGAQTIFIYNTVLKDTKVPIICLGNRMNQSFAYSDIVRIAELNVHENVVFDRTFYSADYIEELNITGTIGQDGFDIHWSKNLNKASIESIINALSEETSGLTVTFSKTAVNNAFGIDVDDETTYTDEWNSLRNSKSNWTFAYN